MLFLIHTGPKKNQNHRKIVRPRTTPDQRTSVRTMLNWAVRRFLPIRIILLVRKMFLHKEIELTSPQDMIGWQEIFRMEIFRFPYFFIFSDHGIKSGLRPMLNCIFHTAISCWYAVSCIPKWTPYFLKNDSVTRIWFLIRLNLFRWIPYSSLLTFIWLSVFDLK